MDICLITGSAGFIGYNFAKSLLEKKGFKADTKIEQGIEELVNLFEKNTTKIINNY